jgi:hypothetical protein
MNFPTGYDWGDGLTILPGQPIGSGGGDKFGTPSPNSAVLTAYPNNDPSQAPQEDPDSPEIERAEQATISHTMSMPWAQGVAINQAVARGTFLQDSGGNVTRVLSCRLKRAKPGWCKLTIIAESISFDTPPDDFQINPIDLGLDIIKHPRYSWAIAPTSNDSTTTTTVGDTVINYVSIKSAIIRMIQAYRDSPFFPSADQINGLIQNNIMGQLDNGFLSVQVPNPDFQSNPSDGVIANPPNWDGTNANKPPGNYPYAIVSVPVDLSNSLDPLAIAMAAAKEIISKLWRQEDTPYLTGFEIVWTQYFFAPAYLDGGGYIQDPLTVVPDYFMQPQTIQQSLARGNFASPFSNQDTVAPNSGQPTIFDKMAQLNPQAYSTTGLSDGNVDISWLRKADEMEFQRTWFAVRHRWVGSPIGNWDKDLYTQGRRPQNANDFDNLI